jgi:hypothetical protein
MGAVAEAVVLKRARQPNSVGSSRPRAWLDGGACLADGIPAFLGVRPDRSRGMGRWRIRPDEVFAWARHS